MLLFFVRAPKLVLLGELEVEGEKEKGEDEEEEEEDMVYSILGKSGIL